jgi:hypothetical protein
MSILFICPCGKTLRVRAEASGRKVKCPGCGTVQRCPPPAPIGLPVPESDQGSGLARPAGTPLPSALVTRSQASPSPDNSKSGSPHETQTFAPPDKPPTETLPCALGAYRVEGVLGRGAFGVVYRAHRRKERDTPVALNAQRPQIAAPDAPPWVAYSSMGAAAAILLPFSVFLAVQARQRGYNAVSWCVAGIASFNPNDPTRCFGDSAISRPPSVASQGAERPAGQAAC